jgi:hypothetical protein
MIKQAIVADPIATDSDVARQTKSSRNTVASVRSEMVFNSAHESKNEHLPISRAEEVAQANPSASVREIAKKAKVSRDTAVNAAIAQPARAVHALADTGRHREQRPTRQTHPRSPQARQGPPRNLCRMHRWCAFSMGY